MAYEQERANIEAVADKHADVPVIPEFSAPAARSIVRRCKVLNIVPPLVVLKFQDRAEGPQGANGARDKIGRDFYGKEYGALSPDEKSETDSLHGTLVNDNPATGHPYLKPGFTFAEARRLLIETYREESSRRYPQEIRAALEDFRNALERDVDDTAKLHGFFKAYSQTNLALRMAAAGTHSPRQTIPIVPARK